MTQTTIAADFRQTLDVHSGLTAQVALDDIAMLNGLTQLAFLLLSQILDAGIGVDTGGLQNLGCTSGSDAVNIGQSNFDPLVAGKIDTRNTCHNSFSTSY